MPPQNGKGAPTKGDALQKCSHASADEKLYATAAEIRQARDRFLADLAALARWKQNLAARIERRQLVLELVDFETDIDDLAEEVELWQATAEALAASWGSP